MVENKKDDKKILDDEKFFEEIKIDHPSEEEFDKKISSIREKLKSPKNQKEHTTKFTINTEKIRRFFSEKIVNPIGKETKELYDKIKKNKKKVAAGALIALTAGSLGYIYGSSPVDDLNHQLAQYNYTISEQNNQIATLYTQLSEYERELMNYNKTLSKINESLYKTSTELNETLEENKELKENLTTYMNIVNEYKEKIDELSEKKLQLEKNLNETEKNLMMYKNIVNELFIEDKIDKNIDFLVYAVRDDRSEKVIEEDVEELVKNGISSVVLSYPGNDEHLISLKEFVKDYTSLYRTVYGEKPEINMLIEGNAVSYDRFNAILHALNKENVTLPEKVYVIDLYGLIINGKGDEVLEMVKLAKQKNMEMVFDINPYYKPTKEQEKILRKILSYSNVKITVFSMQYFANKKYSSDEEFIKELEEAVKNVKSIADKYQKDFIAPIIVSHDNVVSEIDAVYLAEYLNYTKKLGIKEYIVNSWDEKNNGTPIALQLYRRLLKS